MKAESKMMLLCLSAIDRLLMLVNMNKVGGIYIKQMTIDANQ